MGPDSGKVFFFSFHQKQWETEKGRVGGGRGIRVGTESRVGFKCLEQEKANCQNQVLLILLYMWLLTVSWALALGYKDDRRAYLDQVRFRGLQRGCWPLEGCVSEYCSSGKLPITRRVSVSPVTLLSRPPASPGAGLCVKCSQCA